MTSKEYCHLFLGQNMPIFMAITKMILTGGRVSQISRITGNKCANGRVLQFSSENDKMKDDGLVGKIIHGSWSMRRLHLDFETINSRFLGILQTEQLSKN